MILKVEKLEKWFTIKKVFEDISFFANSTDKIGIIGTNGIGKTTLLNILAGEDNDYKGQTNFYPKELNLFYGKQHPIFDSRLSVIELVGLERDRSRYILKKLGFTEKDMDKSVNQLSGGMRTKITLAQAMYKESDLLILDEPNNHLDMEQLRALEEFLKEYRGTLLLVTHDRKLLDNICNKILELRADGCRMYNGNYSEYISRKEIEKKEQQVKYENYIREKESLQQAIVRHKEWFRSAHKAAGQNDFLRAKAKKQASTFKAKEKALERLEKHRVKKVKEVEEINLKFEKAEVCANILVRAEDLSKNYSGNIILENCGFILRRRERYCLTGQNGSGKTTLLNMLCGIDKDFEGTIKVNPSLRVAYYRQLHENLDMHNTIIDEIKQMGVSSGEARLLLGSFLIRGEEVFKRVDELSVGERSKLSMLKVLMTCADLLILDEPTNHMDIYAKERIEEALLEYDGTVVFVSHDRYFNERISTKVFAIEGKTIVEYPGNYDYYREKKISNNTSDDLDIKHSIMLLETKCSYLAGRLSEVGLHEELKKQLEAEYFEICGRLRAMRL